MKITDIKKFIIGNPHKNWLFVKVYTDEGITGLGEATAGLSTMPQAGEIDEIFDMVIGEDPLQPERIWHKIFKKLYLKTCHGLNSIELACWDILGKSLNVPVWKLLGGQQREKLRVYANGWYKGPRTPESYAESAMALVEKGYTAMKLDPFGSAYLSIEKTEERLAQDIIRTIREAVGNDVDICVEAHDRFSIPTAIRIAAWLEEFRPLFLEAPVITCDIKGAITVAKASKIPIATGEQFKTLQDFRDLTSARSIAYSQPEVMNLGLGIALKACAMSEANSQLIACHQAQSPLCTAINANIHAVIPNFLIQECFDDTIEPWVWELLDGVPRVKNGYLEVPVKPGWGVELNEKEAAKHPYSSHNFLRLFEDGWEKQVSWERQ
jgi:galactonate dehydratase